MIRSLRYKIYILINVNIVNLSLLLIKPRENVLLKIFLFNHPILSQNSSVLLKITNQI